MNGLYIFTQIESQIITMFILSKCPSGWLIMINRTNYFIDGDDIYVGVAIEERDNKLESLISIYRVIQLKNTSHKKCFMIFFKTLYLPAS